MLMKKQDKCFENFLESSGQNSEEEDDDDK